MGVPSMQLLAAKRAAVSLLDPVPDQIAALSPVLYYRCGESSGNIVSTGSSTPTTTATGTPTYSVAGALSGDSNTAITVAPGSYFSMGASVAVTASQTRLAWVKTTSSDATAGQDANSALTLICSSTPQVWDSFGIHGGKARFKRYDTAWRSYDSVTSVNDGNWHMIGVTYNSSTRAIEIYVDGSADASYTHGVHDAQGTINRLGVGYQAVDGFDGTFDEVAVFTSVLTAQNFSDLWDASIGA